jgi:TorA maturation chaperone TorD
MISDREIHSFRRGYYDVLGALFRREPSGEFLRQLAGWIGAQARVAPPPHPLLGAGWNEIEQFLNGASFESLAAVVTDEYTWLFLGPHAPRINPYESFYLTGRLLDRPLADIRTFLKTVGLEKVADCTEPEDFLAFELEVVSWLVGKQLAAGDPQAETRFLTLQSDFLKNHLLIWGPACGQDIERANGANFYRSAAKLLQGFLALELNFFRQWGIDQLETLQAARLRYGTFPTWKGPTFDVPGEKGGETLSKDEES